MASENWSTRWKAWARTKGGGRWINLARILFVAGIVAVLVYKLTDVGWGKVLTAFPATPWFYVLWVGLYVALPLADAYSYRILWSIPYWTSLPVFFRKKIYGADVMNYSGEVYVFFWARRQLEEPGRELAKDIRDNTIVSSITSTLISLVVGVAYLSMGPLNVRRFVHADTMVYVIPGVLLTILLLALGIRFRRYLYDLPAKTTAQLMGVHGARIAALHLMQVGQWVVVMPDMPMQVWFSYLMVQIVVNAIPIVPSKDLIFLGLGVGLAGPLGAPEAGIAGVLLAKSALDKLTNLVLFVYTSIRSPELKMRDEGVADTGVLAGRTAGG